MPPGTCAGTPFLLVGACSERSHIPPLCPPFFPLPPSPIPQVLSPKDQQQYWSVSFSRHSFVSAVAFQEAFNDSTVGKALQEEFLVREEADEMR